MAGSTGREALGIVWEGDQQSSHSFAVVNREICRKLIERGHEICVAVGAGQSKGCTTGDTGNTGHPLAGEGPATAARPVAAHVRHQWPPNFTPPPAGHWIIIQPREYGSLPRQWIEAMSRDVDEVWAYSSFVRDCYIQSGLPSVADGRSHAGAWERGAPTRSRARAEALPKVGQVGA